ncbi:MAG: hypothetical protein NTY01_05350 [Verrucomicrobia bacterium]|nr:hypothetical protein [Verrucomicrobiota bacterium]
MPFLAALPVYLNNHRPWFAPPSLPKDGVNQIELTLREGDPATIVFLDLSTP